MLHDKSTPPLPRETRRTRAISAHSRYTVPSIHNNRLISPMTSKLSNLPPPPGPTYILPPPPPPRRAHYISTTTTTTSTTTHNAPMMPPKSSSMTFLTQSTTETATMYYNYKSPRTSRTPHTPRRKFNFNYNNNSNNNKNKNKKQLKVNKKRIWSNKERAKENINLVNKKHINSKSSPNVYSDIDRRDIMFFATMNGIETYSVIYYTNLCGLELYPYDNVKTNGAKIINCHNLYSKNRVIINSLLIGINDKIVLNVKYNKILKTIRFAPRPLKLTFHPPPKYKKRHINKKNVKNFDNLTLWLADDNSIRFTSKQYK